MGCLRLPGGHPFTVSDPSVVADEPHLADVPIVMLTGSRDIDDVAHAFRLGVRDHIAKPFRSKDLRARIAAALDRRAAAVGAST